MTRAERALPVAVFDSGVGGLTVLHECLVSLPHEDLVYLGDPGPELRAAGLENADGRRGHHGFPASGDPEEFRRLGTRFLQLPIGEVRRVEVARPAKAAA